MAQRKNDKKSRFFNKFRNKLRLFFSMNSMWFFIFAVLSLVIPDLVLKSRVIFVDFRVDEGPLLRFLLCDFIPLLFTALWVCLILFICVYMLPKRYGRLLFILIATLSNVLMISEFIYYTMFGRFFMLNSIFLATEGAAYIPILHQYISGQLILWTILSITSLVMACILWKKYTIPKKFWSIGLIFPVAILSLSLSMTVSDAEKTDTEIWSTWKRPRFVYSDMADPDRCMRVMGIYQFMARSVTYPLFYDSGFTDEDYDRVAKYIEERNDFFDTHPAENEMTGYFKDKNVVVIMLESIDDWMISEETTPTIYELMNNGINFKNHIASPFGGGYTFNSEFALNTGYYTPKSSSTASIYGYNEFPYTLPKLFKKKGYSANQFHYNKMEFYNRATMHKSFGYDDYISFMDYLPEQEAELDSNAMLLPDDEIYKKMTENEKFFDFVITYTAHLPYAESSKVDIAAEKYPELIDLVSTDDFKAMLLEADAACDEIDLSSISDQEWEAYAKEYNTARLLAKDTDEFIRLFKEKLEADNLLDDTVLVIFADHYTYGYSNQDIVKGLSVRDGERFIEETPFFIYHSGTPKEEADRISAMIENKVSSTKDILPTLVNLFDLDRFNGYIGDDIFDPNNEKGFVYFSNMTWYDGEIFRDDSLKITNDIKKTVETNDKKLMTYVDINDIIVAGDYFSKRK